MSIALALMMSATGRTVASAEDAQALVWVKASTHYDDTEPPWTTAEEKARAVGEMMVRLGVAKDYRIVINTGSNSADLWIDTVDPNPRPNSNDSAAMNAAVMAACTAPTAPNLGPPLPPVVGACLSSYGLPQNQVDALVGSYHLSPDYGAIANNVVHAVADSPPGQAAAATATAVGVAAAAAVTGLAIFGSW
jgi:hypothetical protein